MFIALIKYLNWLWIPVVVSGLIVIVLGLRKYRKKADSVSGDRATKKPNAEQDQKKALIDEYVELLKMVNLYDSYEIYIRYFERYSGVYQTICGLKRQREKENLSDDRYLDILNMAVSNSYIEKALNTDGFMIKPNITAIKREKIEEELIDIEPDMIKMDIAQQKRLLNDFKKNEFFKELLEGTEKEIYQVIKSAKERNAEEVIRYSAETEKSMIKHHCIPIFSDDAVAVENDFLRLSFCDDNPQATELPALCKKSPNGEYTIIGRQGTRRVKP